MNFEATVKDFLESVVTELSVEDATAMFSFLGVAIKSNPGKLAKLAKLCKDPKTLEEIQSLASTKNKIALMSKVHSLYKKLS